jgi:hypothetical protein
MLDPYTERTNQEQQWGLYYTLVDTMTIPLMTLLVIT